MQRFFWWMGLLCLVALVSVLTCPDQATAQQSAQEFKGLVPGRSTLNEVHVALGRSSKTRTAGDLTMFFWPPTMPPGKVALLENMVALRGEVVQYMLVGDAAEFEADPKKLVAQWGKPQGVTRNSFSANSSYYHYPLRGVSFLVDTGPGQPTDTVVAKMIYPPTDWAGLQAAYTWARDYTPTE